MHSMLRPRLKNPSRFITKEYDNAEFRYWNPRTWYGNVTYRHIDHSPITIQVRGKKVFITADSLGHELVRIMEVA